MKQTRTHHQARPCRVWQASVCEVKTKRGTSPLPCHTFPAISLAADASQPASATSAVPGSNDEACLRTSSPAMVYTQSHPAFPIQPVSHPSFHYELPLCITGAPVGLRPPFSSLSMRLAEPAGGCQRWPLTVGGPEPASHLRWRGPTRSLRPIRTVSTHLPPCPGSAGTHMRLPRPIRPITARFPATANRSPDLRGLMCWSVEQARSCMTGFRRIRSAPRYRCFSPAELVERPIDARRWLEQRLTEPFGGPTVVVAHRAPAARSIQPTCRQSPLAPAYASDFSDWIRGKPVDCWLHGQLYSSGHYRPGIA
jgi:hypothetical protein